MTPADRVYVAGHTGLVGSAVVRRLEAEGFRDLVLRSRHELDLADAAAVRAFFEQQRPAYVFLCAARVGGIAANHSRPADFIRDNLRIQQSVIDAAHDTGVRKLLFLGSSCVYPRLAPQPIREDALLTGPLEPTNEWYAMAKLAGIKLCQAYRRQYGDDFIAVMPTNLYGPGDNYDLDSSHVLAALIRKLHEAREAGLPEVVLWGSGTPRREFLYVDDLADALVFLMRAYSSAELVNIGWGKDISIAELAELVRGVTGFEGDITWDTSLPDGVPRKLLDTSRLRALGWAPRVALQDGLEQTYTAYLEQLRASAIDLPADLAAISERTHARG